MLSVTKEYVIGRKGNIVLVGFGRKPEPPAPRFPGASGLREDGAQDCQTQEVDRLHRAPAKRWGAKLVRGARWVA